PGPDRGGTRAASGRAPRAPRMGSMGRDILRRAVQAIGTLLLVMFLLLLLTTVAIQLNGNPAPAFFGDKIATPAQIAAVEQRFNLDDPCYDQVGNPCLGP